MELFMSVSANPGARCVPGAVWDGSVSYYAWNMVPVLPCTASLDFSRSVIRAVRPGLEDAKSIAACTFGSMEPGAKWPSFTYCSASSTETSLSHFSSGLPKLSATYSTAVRMIR